ncbi:hypothetical protein O6H91_06G106000 [Diphasiastrum complanatum]|uniref:Uncharacterized protein n=1 Tax=Diphasiastrum complanatum TaxID=34168 RepID=A0ACC2DHP3_DIPCM|nr:hypothetical protein O6H91_06G106000 [Diphasiastrum complanatum]
MSKERNGKALEIQDSSTGDKQDNKRHTADKRSKQKDTVAYWKLFQYADVLDVVLMVAGSIAAMINGFMVPAMLFIQSHLIHDFGTLQNNPLKLSEEISKDATFFVYVASAAFVASSLEIGCWMLTGDRQASKIRANYLRAILRQDVAFFDTQVSTAQVINNVSVDTEMVQDAISEKVGNFILSISMFFGGMLLAFIQTWRMALIMIPFVPLLLLPGFFYGRALTGFANRRATAYSEAGIVAEQALSSIRTVYSFVGERNTLESFSRALESTVKVGLKQGLAKGLAVGSNGITYALWALMSWYGSVLVRHGQANGGKVLTSGFAIISGGIGLGNTATSLRAFSEGCAAAHRIFEVLGRVPPIDADSDEGEVLQNPEGRLQLTDVQFAYPSRAQELVLRSLNLDIPAGKTVALVGSSGCGKSTVIGLLERFYDPLKGSVLLDGIDIKELQLRWFRKQIGLVSQEPALFATSIKENILYGKEDASMDEVVSAAKLSNIHEFIQKLPLHYDTHVGERGVQMSGGQKQRIAIARAIIKDPKILLLDEATSALDSESEFIVQKALDRASVGRTTVIVAHRLSTIRNADLIAVIQRGTVIELGNHEELLAKGSSGAYSTLVSLQQAAAAADHDKPSLHDIDVHEEEIESIQLQMSVKEKQAKLGYLAEDVSASIDFSADFPTQAQKVRKNIMEKKDVPKVPSFRRLLALNRPEWRQGLFGLIGAIGFGFTQPFYAFLIGSMVSIFYEQNHHKVKEKIKLFSGIFVLLCVACFIINLVQHYNCAAVGEYLTKRLRERMLATILRFEVGWFDRDENLSGALCSRLSSDANMIRNFIGDRIGLLAQTSSAIVVSIVLAVISSWRLAVVMVGLQPLIIACFYARKTIAQGSAQSIAKAQQDASQVAGEAVSQHRTITAYCSQDRVLKIFHAKLMNASIQTWKRAQIAGLGFGVAQFCLFSSWALSFWYAGILVKHGQATMAGIFRTFFVLISTGRVIADAGTLTPDWVKSTAAVISVFDILDRKTEINADDNHAEIPGKLQGFLQLMEVSFSYPSRPDVIVFRNLSFEVRTGQTFALVGQSGSGKSSIIGLIERFYDPITGKVMIDGKDIINLQLKSLRYQIGLVSQEPTLFARSIRENIAYGKDNSTEEEIIAAAQAANAHDFISSLPNGYSTQAGEWGLHLSGGQKQRICIARAILKTPAILLLDEATSALDSQSERIVQDTLNQIMIGRTTVLVAHRLSTVQNADMIAVLQDGAIVEQGSHKELYDKGEEGLITLFSTCISSRLPPPKGYKMYKLLICCKRLWRVN